VTGARNFQRVAVLGAGTMGNGIVQTFATHGAQVTMIDVSEAALEKGLATIRKSLARFADKEKITAAEGEAILARIRTSNSLGDAKPAQLVVEAVVEKADVKRQVFRELDAVTPEESILATYSSSISITEIAAATRLDVRVIGMHFMYTVPLMTLVEVIRGQETSVESCSRVMEASWAVG
jgi:3-hydroxybutyryl-CoA dehydrogenase